jgi:hypothetical protein
MCLIKTLGGKKKKVVALKIFYAVFHDKHNWKKHQLFVWNSLVAIIMIPQHIKYGNGTITTEISLYLNLVTRSKTFIT